VSNLRVGRTEWEKSESETGGRLFQKRETVFGRTTNDHGSGTLLKRSLALSGRAAIILYMQKSGKQLNRRRFLGTSGGLSAAGGLWLWQSNSWAARFLRERIAEIGRNVPAAPQRPVPFKWSDSDITAAWLGHATVLVNFFGVKILTDPVFFSRVGPDWRFAQIGPQRLVRCALHPRALPAIDLVLVSHAHFDHLDTPSLRAVPGKPALVTARATADLIPVRRFSRVQELRWGESATLDIKAGQLRVQAFEVKHWGARWRKDRHRGYNGYVIEREGKRIIFGGDTARAETFAALRRPQPAALAFMPIGAYNPWIHSHCTPEQALAMANAARAEYLAPIHHQSFKLSREPVSEPIERMTAALAQEPERLAVREIGGTFLLKT
jgi:L-ascorbate metabolism protein UlaG (beta-lactamase superfamily)